MNVPKIESVAPVLARFGSSFVIVGIMFKFFSIGECIIYWAGTALGVALDISGESGDKEQVSFLVSDWDSSDPQLSSPLESLYPSLELFS